MVGRGCICAVYGCSNYKLQANTKSFYRFPKNKEMCAQWLIRTKREDLHEVLKTKGTEHLYKNYAVCSDHFTEKEFRNKNLLSKGIWPGALPSLLLHNAVKNVTRSSPKKRNVVRYYLTST